MEWHASQSDFCLGATNSSVWMAFLCHVLWAPRESLGTEASSALREAKGSAR